MDNSFWKNKKIVGQSPMDGVSDAAFRYITDKYGNPDVLFTEFIPVEGISRGAAKILKEFVYHETKTPTVAQIYGVDLYAYKQATLIACFLGFDGIDINMGCPDKSVTKRGAGAGLVKNPKLAKSIIKTVKKTVYEWRNGLNLEDLEIRKEIVDKVKTMMRDDHQDKKRHSIPVSVKTRIGYDKPVTKEWIKNLASELPDAISLHGRTLTQMYTGSANWDEIAKAGEICKENKITFLGNGDIKTINEAQKKIDDYKLDGVLIGRALFGNPWFFKNKIPTTKERLKVALEHSKIFSKMLPDGHFLSLRKHLAWYTKSFHNSADTRRQLMSVENYEDVERILNPLIDIF